MQNRGKLDKPGFLTYLSEMDHPSLKSLPKLLRTRDVADALGVRVETVSRYIKTGRLKGWRRWERGHLEIWRDDLQIFLDRTAGRWDKVV